MRPFKPGPLFSLGDRLRYLLLLCILTGSLAFALSLKPLVQDAGYHNFSDHRALLGIPNCLNVVSNLPFLLVGVAGIVLYRRDRASSLGSAWLVFFLGVTAVSAGSTFYHVHPNDDTLVWDRLPMAAGFMGLFMALLGEHVSVRLANALLIPAVALGFFSVFYWYALDDLRFYYWIQFMPLLMIPVVMMLFRPRYTHRWLFPASLVFYAAAKITEAYDQEVFACTHHLVSGHTLKHLLAALSCFAVLLMAILRKATGQNTTA